MNRRSLLSGILMVACAAALWGVFVQRQQLVDLRTEQQQLVARTSSEASQPAPVTAASPAPGTLELLRLRSDITRLMERRRALTGVSNENERLRVEVATHRTNSPAGVVLPPGYMRISQAQMLGYTTPEDTLQSALWAMRSRDFTNLMQAFTPEAARELQTQVEHSGETAEAFMQKNDCPIGFRVVDKKQQTDGSVTLRVELVPGLPPGEMHFQWVGGQWKLAGL